MKARIPFRIGYQYDNWELDLITLPDRIPEDDLYISYLWVGKDIKKFLTFTPHKTELIFYWDILNTVILTFLERDIEYYNKIINTLKIKFGNAEKHHQNRIIIHKFKYKNLQYWSMFYSGSIIILYGIEETINRFYNTLLC